MSDIGAVIFQWLRRIGLEYAIPAFESMQITTPHALMNMQWEHYDALGIHDPDDRKRLYELVQRVRDASRKGSEVRRPRQSLAPGSSSNDLEHVAHARSSLSNNMPSRESILGADIQQGQQEMARVVNEYRRENMHLSLGDDDDDDEDSGIISSERLGSRAIEDSVDSFPVHNANSSANVPAGAPRQPPAPIRRLRVMPSAIAALKKREAEAAAAAAAGNMMSAGIGPNAPRSVPQRASVPRQSISNQPLSRRNLSAAYSGQDSALSSRQDGDNGFESGDYFSSGAPGAEVKQRRTSLPTPGSRVPSSANVLNSDSMTQDSEEFYDTDHGDLDATPSVSNNRATVKIDNILSKNALVDPDAPRIRVVVRKRPMSKREADSQELDVVNVVTKTELQVHEIKRKVDLTRYTEASEFTFDDVFDETVTTGQIYQHTAQPLISSIFNGANATCFAYGQTGSGKTYTMMGNLKDGAKLYDSETGQCESDAGLYVLAARDIFAYLDAYHEANPVEQVRGFDKRGARRYCVVVSFYEIYGGKLFDLLNNREPLKALVDAKGDVNVLGIVEQPVFSVDSLLKFIDHGISVRSTGSTGANADSSRSHAVLQITLAHAQADGKGGLNVITDPRTRHVAAKGKFSFIDLAGSERGADTFKNDKKTRLEGAEINKSLLALKECIRSLYHQADYNPFRGSKLTQVLKDSFIGDAHTVMIATISPNQSNTEHTLNTLRYAYRLKEISGGNVDIAYEPPYGLRGQVNEYGEEPYDNRAESLMTVPGGPLGGLSNYLAKQAGMHLNVPASAVSGPAAMAPPLPTPGSRNTSIQTPSASATPNDSVAASRQAAPTSIPASGRGSVQGRSSASVSATSVSATLAAIGNASAVASAVAASARKPRESSLVQQRKPTSAVPSQTSQQKPTTTSIPSQTSSRGSSINARSAANGIPSRSSIPTLSNRQASNSVPPSNDTSSSVVSTPSPRRDRSARDASTAARMRALSGSPITSPHQRNTLAASEITSPLRQVAGSPHTSKLLQAQQDTLSPREMAVDAKTPASVRGRKELVPSPLMGPARTGRKEEDSIGHFGSPNAALLRDASRNENEMQEDYDDASYHAESELETSILSAGVMGPTSKFTHNGGTTMIPLEVTDTALLNTHITTLRRLEMLASREKLEIKSFLSGPDEPAVVGREGLSAYISRMTLLLTKKITLLKTLMEEFSEYNEQYGHDLQELAARAGVSTSPSSPHGKASSGISAPGRQPESITSPVTMRSPVQARKTSQSYFADNDL